jgi:hypothetical protein
MAVLWDLTNIVENMDTEKIRCVQVQALVIEVLGFWPAPLAILEIKMGSMMLVKRAKIAKTKLARLPSRTASSIIFACSVEDIFMSPARRGAASRFVSILDCHIFWHLELTKVTNVTIHG